jgi:hypothetical protein
MSLSIHDTELTAIEKIMSQVLPSVLLVLFAEPLKKENVTSH